MILIQRIIFGAIYAILAICLFLFASPTVTAIVMAVVSIAALTEFLKATSVLNNKSKLPLTIISYVFCIAMIVEIIEGGSLYQMKSFTVFANDYGYLIPVIMLYIIISFVAMVLNHKNISFSEVSASVVGNIYITVSLMHLYLIRILPDGKFYIWLPFLIAWLTDTFAYFTGFFIGKHKLIPSVSPKKTIEGSIGGIVGAIIIVALFQYVCFEFFGFEPNYIKGVIVAVVCSIASQFGDLAASCIKREHGVKDFGSIMPGHGGVLDRFDSVIYISPIVFLALNFIKII